MPAVIGGGGIRARGREAEVVAMLGGMGSEGACCGRRHYWIEIERCLHSEISIYMKEYENLKINYDLCIHINES